MFDFMKIYFKVMEENIGKLPEGEIGAVYAGCGQNCAKYGVLNEYKKLYEKCSGNMDSMFSSMHELGDVSGRVISSDSEYEMEFPRCLCQLYQEGYLSMPSHCECSKQSILYVLNNLFPEKKVEVKIIGTVLSGNDKCVFRIKVLE